MATILLVEDKPRLQDLFHRELERAGHRVSSAACGQEALTYCQREPVDTVIIEIPLRDGDGLATISALRRRDPALRIVALSGEPYATKILLQAQAWGANVTLLIPMAMNELLKAVEGRTGPCGGPPGSQAAASRYRRWAPTAVR